MDSITEAQPSMSEAKSTEGQVTFSVKDDVWIDMSKGKFKFKGEEIDDIHNVYDRFNEWLSAAEIQDK